MQRVKAEFRSPEPLVKPEGVAAHLELVISKPASRKGEHRAQEERPRLSTQGEE